MTYLNENQPPSQEAIKQLVTDWISYNNIRNDPHENTRRFRKVIEMNQHPLSYVSGKVHEYGTNWPEAAWVFINELIEQAPSQALLVNIAAGPLEGLLTHHTQIFIDRVEERARKDVKFRACLAIVWQNQIPSDAWQRMVVACNNRQVESIK